VREVLGKLSIGSDRNRVGILVYSSALRQRRLLEIGAANSSQAVLDKLEGIGALYAYMYTRVQPRHS
jgi:hypothetical protein